MARYADKTDVPVEKSRAEIEKLLTRYGATAFGYMRAGRKEAVEFVAKDRRIRFTLPMPDPKDKQFMYTPARKFMRTNDEAYKAWEMACRQRWRALLLSIKAKLEAVECGITEFEDEFLAHIVLPDGGTASEWLRPQVELAYQSGRMPQQLFSLPAPRSEDRDVVSVQ
jgi:hypothetical protein